jgi:ubiquinone biosynthesis protein UbiJ
MPASSLIPELFTHILQEAVTHFLQLDPHSADYLAPLAGRLIVLKLMPMNWQISLCPSETAISICTDYYGEPDVVFTGSVLAFARLSLSKSPRRALFAGDAMIEGDMKVAAHFQNLFERFEINWEGRLSQFIGEGFASRLTHDLRTVNFWGRETLQAWGANIAEFAQEESRTVPAPAEAEAFFSDVDTLRADYDRLEARFNRVSTKLADTA